MLFIECLMMFYATINHVHGNLKYNKWIEINQSHRRTNRPFAGKGHVTISIIKIGGFSCQKWKEHDEISKVANFEVPAG